MRYSKSQRGRAGLRSQAREKPKSIGLLALTNTLFLLACSLFQESSAFVRSYEPSLQDSAWDVAPHHPLECTLSQEIPYYGKATFLQNAGKKPAFKLSVERGPEDMTNGELMSSPPVWLPGLTARGAAEIPLHPGTQPVRLASQEARWMLAELEVGWQPTLVHSDWDNSAQQVIAKLSAVNFREAFTDFRTCQRQLLSYGYDDIKRSTIYYRGGSKELSRNDTTLLDKIIRYVEVDPEIKMVVVRSYTDSVGTRQQNYLLSIERLRIIEEYLQGRGISKDKIDAVAYGERQPAADNSTAEGRAKNRRLSIFLRR